MITWTEKQPKKKKEHKEKKGKNSISSTITRCFPIHPSREERCAEAKGAEIEREDMVRWRFRLTNGYRILFAGSVLYLKVAVCQLLPPTGQTTAQLGRGHKLRKVPVIRSDVDAELSSEKMFITFEGVNNRK
jgi:hypothetical protein